MKNPEKSVEEIGKYLANEIHSCFASAYAIKESVSHEWLKKVITEPLQTERQKRYEVLEKNLAWCPQCGDALEQDGTKNDYSCFGCDVHYQLTYLNNPK